MTKRFLEDNGLQLLVRSHEVKDEGYEVAHGEATGQGPGCAWAGLGVAGLGCHWAGRGRASQLAGRLGAGKQASHSNVVDLTGGVLPLRPAGSACCAAAAGPLYSPLRPPHPLPPQLRRLHTNWVPWGMTVGPDNALYVAVNADGYCITVFSAPNYCDQMGNKVRGGWGGVGEAVGVLLPSSLG